MTTFQWIELIVSTALYAIGHYHGRTSGLANQGVALAKQVISSLPPPNHETLGEETETAAGKAALTAGKNAGK